MAKRVNMREALERTARPEPRSDTPVEPDEPSRQTGRASKRNVTGYFPPEVAKQLRVLAAEQDRTIQDCLAEALNDWFAKNGKPEIAPRDT